MRLLAAGHGGKLKMDLKIIAQHDFSPDQVDSIEDRLYEHNSRSTGHDDARGLVFVIRDGADRLIGAAAGYSWARTSELKQLWVDEAFRSRGYGRMLLDAFVREAQLRGVLQLWAASHDFQAPVLYDKAGFERMAEFADWPPGHSNIIFRKILSASQV